jgi:iron complex transport system substrate-binding protein
MGMNMCRLMIYSAALLSVSACAPLMDQSAGSEAAEERPQRVVSLNLCADQLLVGLADKDQIAGLTRNVNDPEMSAVAAQIVGLPILGNASEEILDIHPDLVIGMPTRRSAALGALQDQDYPALDLKTARNLDDIYASITATAKALGHADRAKKMVADMQRDLADIGTVGQGRVAAYYQRRGFMTGTGTLIDDMMIRSDLVNLAAKLGKPSLAQVSLEEMVDAKPDFIIMESSTAAVSDQGSEMLHHPALAGIPRIYLPQAWTVCGSPAYVQAARTLAEQIQRHDQKISG